MGNSRYDHILIERHNDQAAGFLQRFWHNNINLPWQYYFQLFFDISDGKSDRGEINLQQLWCNQISTQYFFDSNQIPRHHVTFTTSTEHLHEHNKIHQA